MCYNYKGKCVRERRNLRPTRSRTHKENKMTNLRKVCMIPRTPERCSMILRKVDKPPLIQTTVEQKSPYCHRVHGIGIKFLNGKYGFVAYELLFPKF